MVSNIFTFVSIFLFFSSVSLPASSLTKQTKNNQIDQNWNCKKKHFNKIANRTKTHTTTTHVTNQICAHSHTPKLFSPDTCSFVCKPSVELWNIFCEFQNQKNSLAKNEKIDNCLARTISATCSCIGSRWTAISCWCWCWTRCCRPK